MGVSTISCKGAETGAVWYELLVPDDQAVGVPMKHLDAITPAVEEEEEMTGEEILLGKGLADDPGEAVEAFPEVHGAGVEENPHGVREADHEGSSVRPGTRATVSTTWQTRSTPAVTGRWIRPPLASRMVTCSAESGGWDLGTCGRITGTNAEASEEKGVGEVVRRASRRFQEWKFAVEIPSLLQNWWIVRPLSGCCCSRRRQRLSKTGSARRGMV
jgi:hypothetical protein